MTLTNPDLTGHCENDHHEQCRKVLTTSTGSHWWCACLCHPERTEMDASVAAHPRDVAAALATFRAAREKLKTATP